MVSINSRSVLALAAVIATLTMPACRAGSGPAAAQNAVPSSAQIVVSDSPAEFEPSDVTIRTGGTVRWINTGGIAHSVEFVGNSDARKPLSGIVLQPNGDYARVFDAPGTYRYLCRFHIISGMVGTVTVVGNANVASADSAPPR
jgi:plastocyanin